MINEGATPSVKIAVADDDAPTTDFIPCFPVDDVFVTWLVSESRAVTTPDSALADPLP